MLRHEFDDILINEHKFTRKQVNAISDSDYKLIEYVYTWHPNVDNVNGKKQVAYLYANFGIGVFHDMEESASLAEDLDTEIKETEKKLNGLRTDYDMLKKGIKYYIENRRDRE